MFNEEEFLHFSMDLEFLLRRTPEWRAAAGTFSSAVAILSKTLNVAKVWKRRCDIPQGKSSEKGTIPAYNNTTSPQLSNRQADPGPSASALHRDQ